MPTERSGLRLSLTFRKIMTSAFWKTIAYTTQHQRAEERLVPASRPQRQAHPSIYFSTKTLTSHPGRIPVLVDNSQSPPFTVHETSAELFYLLKFADKQDKFGFSDDLERNQALQWTLYFSPSCPLSNTNG